MPSKANRLSPTFLLQGAFPWRPARTPNRPREKAATSNSAGAHGSHVQGLRSFVVTCLRSRSATRSSGLDLSRWNKLEPPLSAHQATGQATLPSHWRKRLRLLCVTILLLKSPVHQTHVYTVYKCLCVCVCHMPTSTYKPNKPPRSLFYFF